MPTSVEIRHAVMGDLPRVIENLAVESRAEYDKGLLNQVVSESDNVFIGLINGEPVMLGGTIRTTLISGRQYLWSLQTKMAAKYAVRFVRETRRFIDSLGVPVYCYTRYDGRWLELMGFKKIGEDSSGLKEYEYGT